MKSVVKATVVAALVSIVMVGCTEKSKSSTTQETKIASPGGTTTITVEKEVKTTGKNPPTTTP